MTKGIAIIGCGRIGRIRGKIASEFPGISWIGLCDINEKLGYQLKDDIEADFFTTDYSELITRPEVDAVIIATSTWSHFEPTLIAIENKRKILENIAKLNYYITYIMLSIFTIYAYIFYLSDLYEQGAHLFVLIFVPPIFILGWPIMYFIMLEKTPIFY